MPVISLKDLKQTLQKGLRSSDTRDKNHAATPATSLYAPDERILQPGRGKTVLKALSLQSDLFVVYVMTITSV